MAEEYTTGISVFEVPREAVPKGASIAKVPKTPAEAVSFKLVPIPEEEELIEEVIPAEVPEFEALAPEIAPEKVVKVAKPAVPEKVVKEVLKAPAEVPQYVLAPVEEGEGDYYGIIYAKTPKEASQVVIAKYGGTAEEYIISKWAEGPEPYFVIKKPFTGEEMIFEEAAPPAATTQATSKVIEGKTVIRRCPACLAEISLPVDMLEWRCPICGEAASVE